MVKIARKGFEVLSKGEGQVTTWWPRNLARVKKEVLAFSWGTNQTMMVTLKWRIKSWMNCWSDLIHLELTHIYWMQSSHMLKMAMLKEKIKIDMFTSSLGEDWKAMAFGLKEINSSISNSVFFWSWVNRYVVLLRLMHHVDRWLFISAQANSCEVWVRERQKS
jgi:hypothetical protein